MKIVVRKGLNIPMAGKPEGPLQFFASAPSQIALNLDVFDSIRFKLLARVGDQVKIGQPLVENKDIPGQAFVSPAGGIVSEIRRGFKRRLIAIVINRDAQEEHTIQCGIEPKSVSREELLNFFLRRGLFPHISCRPFNLLPNPKLVPRDIFISAYDTRPFAVPCEMQVQGYETYFQAGLSTLKQLTTGQVHLIHNKDCTYKAFTQASHVAIHQITGPHPAGNSSVHIQKIAPIRHAEDYVWSLAPIAVITIGKMVLEGRYFTERIISLAGNGILEDKRGYFAGRMGMAIKNLAEDRLSICPLRLISGDPLSGQEVTPSDFLGFFDLILCAIPENQKREFFHFFRLGGKKFTATRTYLSGLFVSRIKSYPFTTNQHGEERAFVDSEIYHKVMPLRIPTVHLIKAILAKDYELAQELGLLEVVPEDFALSAFICPSKIEMVQIVKEGLVNCIREIGH